MARILVTDDEIDIYDLIKGYASREGHTCVHAKNGLEAVEFCKTENFDLIIMDVMMDQMDGFTATKEIYKTKKIPVIMLTALGAEYDKLHGYDLGIEDYVVKPFSVRELMARINVVLRRGGNDLSSQKDDFLVLGNLRIDKSGRNVFAENKKVDLTVKEFELLEYFTDHKGQALTRSQILNGVWGEGYYLDDRNVDWQVKLLRKKLGKNCNYIETLRGVGYKFEIEK
jgi:DNA-binding response OmpR family regulator